MRERLILEDLIVKLSEKAGVSPESAADFLRAFISNAGGAITSDRQLEVDNLGTFTVNETISGENTVVFIPDDGIADAINAPFALFDAVELNDGVNLTAAEPEHPGQSSVQGTASETEATAQLPSVTVPEPRPAHCPTPSPIEETGKTLPPEPPVYNQPIAQNEVPAHAPAPPVADAPTAPQPMAPPPPSNIRIEVVTTPQPQQQSLQPAQQPAEAAPPGPVAPPEVRNTEVEHYRRRSIFCCRALCAIIVMMLVIGAYFFGLFTPAISEWALSHIQEDPSPAVKIETQSVTPVPAETSTATDDTPGVEAKTAPVKEINHGKDVRLDTVRSDYYFTHMARRYYGNNAFWSYIYKENEANLGNPDYTKVGTVVVIPPAAKYEIDANDPHSVKRAKQLGYEIYRDNKGKK